MLKPMLKLIRHRGRGVKAPALPAASSNLLLRRFGRASRGHVLAGAGVIAAAVTVVSLLTWWAPDSDRPIGHPLEVIERALPGVLEEVDEQVATLLGVEKGTILRNVREGLVAVGSGISRPVEKLREVTADRSSANASSSPAAPASATLPASNTAVPTPGESSPTSNESPQTASGPAAPLRTEEPSSPPASEEKPPTTSEPVSPPTPASPPTPETPPATETPSPGVPPPSTPEKLPLPADEIADKPAPPTAEEPPPGAPPEAPEAPPPAPDVPPSTTDQPPPPPTTGRTADAE